MPSPSTRSYGGRRRNYYQVQVSDISASIVPEDPECPPGPYRCYLEVSVDTVRKRTRVSRKGNYAWDETFEFSVREDWPICIQLLARRAFYKDVLLASSGDWMQLPTNPQTQVVTRFLRDVHLEERNGVPGIYQASVTWKLGLTDPHPITDHLSPNHPEEPIIEDVGELIAAPNPSRVELNGKALRHLSIGFGCHSFSDVSSFIVSLHDFEDASLSSGNSSSSDHNDVLVSPVSDLPHGGLFPPDPRETDDAEKEATLTDYNPNDNLDGGRLSEIKQILDTDEVDSMISIRKDTGMTESPSRRRASMNTSSFWANRSPSLNRRKARHTLWRRLKLIFSWRRPRNIDGENHP
ncbi:hypothetical protein K503DRAFT_770917 [Rhizopogon vinicolor AM-OR11-026]|uniref:C2 domain-containing protein n=1 Tax=Rhizopogon vinicolor AM-OR11-026 TaxID=1314800 RepID=A0A1B7MZK5_9AGAM|nr:hypothetical protein K503DRAFT_770917 [Rhizopogon vinicolor AM-OR11-026]